MSEKSKKKSMVNSTYNNIRPNLTRVTVLITQLLGMLSSLNFIPK